MIDRETTPRYCSMLVATTGLSAAGHRHQCRNPPSRDGFCHMHHPETIKRKDRKRAAAWKTETRSAAHDFNLRNWSSDCADLIERIANADVRDLQGHVLDAIKLAKRKPKAPPETK